MLVLLAGCASRGASESSGPGFVAPTPPPLVDAAPLERVNSPSSSDGGSTRNAARAPVAGQPVADTTHLDTGLRDLEEEMARMKPGVDRLLEIENDIRILLGQLAAISDAPAPASTRDTNAPVQPLSPDMADASPPASLSPDTPQPLSDAPEPPAAFTPEMPSVAPLSPSAQPDPIPLFPPSDSAAFQPPTTPPPMTNDPPGFDPPPRTAPVATTTPLPVADLTGPLDGVWPPIDAPAPLASAPPLAAGGESAPAAVRAPEPFGDDGPPPALAAPAPSVASPGSGVFFAHLASYNDAATATAGWAVLTAQSAELLGGLSPRIEEKNLGERGVFHRLHAGPIANRADAVSLCARLQAKQMYCEVAQLASGS